MRALVVNESFYPVHPPKQVLTSYFDKFKPQKLVSANHSSQIETITFQSPHYS